LLLVILTKSITTAILILIPLDYGDNRFIGGSFFFLLFNNNN